MIKILKSLKKSKNFFENVNTLYRNLSSSLLIKIIKDFRLHYRYLRFLYDRSKFLLNNNRSIIDINEAIFRNKAYIKFKEQIN